MKYLKNFLDIIIDSLWAIPIALLTVLLILMSDFIINIHIVKIIFKIFATIIMLSGVIYVILIIINKINIIEYNDKPYDDMDGGL